MEWKNIELSDKNWIDPLLKASGYQGCDYTFGNLYIWKDLYRQQVAQIEGMLCVRSRRPGTGEYAYLYPAGNGDFSKVIRALQEDAGKLAVPLVLRGMGKAETDRLMTEFPGVFQVEDAREQWDYLYRTEDLANLAGKKYHKKRNHIAKFENSGEWQFVLLTKENMEDCRTMCEAWYGEHLVNGNMAVMADRGVVDNALTYFEELGFSGGVLYQFGQAVGFTIGEPLNRDTYVVHVEKAFADVSGAYPMINREYVRHVMKDYTYVNREEDDGIEGLRRAKESYYPIMYEKFVARELR